MLRGLAVGIAKKEKADRETDQTIASLLIPSEAPLATGPSGDRATVAAAIEVLSGSGSRQAVLFNNLVSFTRSRERAGEFGDYILATRVPSAKVFFYCGLLPGILKGEDEYLVIGGTYEVEITTL